MMVDSPAPGVVPEGLDGLAMPRLGGGGWRTARPVAALRSLVPSRPWARLGRSGIAVLVLALCSLAGSLILRAVLYPRGSGDADEAAYILQARMLLDGRLTLDAHAVEPFFRPWLTGVHGDQVFTKYLPGWPALLAASLLLFGTMAVAPAAIGACWVIGTYLLARELFDDTWTALAAAAVVALSPLVLVHTALPLAYAPSAALLTLASAFLLRGMRTGLRRPLVAGGAVVGFVLLIRPFDAILVLVPLVLFAVARMWRTPAALLTRSAWAALGALPLVALLLAFCWHVTGSPLRLPQTASDPLDTFGFGPRRILPSEPAFLYTRRLALKALWETLTTAPSWYFGGLGLIVLAVVGLVAPRRRLERLLLLATTGAALGGYFFWWGSAFAMVGLRNGLGPHYHLAGFTPVIILAASGARWLWTLLPERLRAVRPVHRAPSPGLVRPTALALAAIGLAALTVPTLPARIDVQHYVNTNNAFLDALIPARLPGAAVIVVSPLVPTKYTQLAYQTLSNSPDLSGRVVYAADIGPGIAALPDRMPDRTIYRLRPNELVDASVPGSFRGSFVQLHQVTGTRLQFQVTVRPPAPAGPDAGAYGLGPGARMYVRLGTDLRSRPLPPSGSGAGPSTESFVLDAGAAGGADTLSAASLVGPAELVVGFTSGDGPGAGRWEDRFPLVRRAGGDLSLLTPGLGWQRLPAGAPGAGTGWLAARIAPSLDVRVTAT